MIVPVDLLLMLVLIITAVLAIWVRNLLAAVAVLIAYSLFVSLLFTEMAAVDVAFVEAVLGGGLVGVLFVVAILLMHRHAHERESPRQRWFARAVVAAFLGLMLYASTGLPDYTDPEAPAHQHVSPTYLERSLEDTLTPNVVTAVLADYRSHDTFGETLVIVTAGLGTLLVLARRDEEDAPP